MPSIKKNLLSISATIARESLVVRFLDNDGCTIHDHRDGGDTIVASGTLYYGIYMLDVMRD